MVEFANQPREERGLSKHDAIVQSARVRLRLILMTDGRDGVRRRPLITAVGAGAKARFAMGIVIASGMSIGTIFTLFVVPMFYTYLSSAHRKQFDEDDAPTPPAETRLADGTPALPLPAAPSCRPGAVPAH